jgi:hypothetical protein
LKRGGKEVFVKRLLIIPVALLAALAGGATRVVQNSALLSLYFAVTMFLRGPPRTFGGGADLG